MSTEAEQDVLPLESSDHKLVAFPLKYIHQSGTLICAHKPKCPPSPVPFHVHDVKATWLETCIQWCRIHENDPKIDRRQRFLSRFEKTIYQEDIELFDKFRSKENLGDLINAAFLLDMPDLATALARYVARSVDGKPIKYISEWMGVPIRSGDEYADAIYGE
ncbi:hypothetical protein QR680_013793 [Steinernema hermaphroditum]|nr:hypothetical protein QR680_013793 [Steinernema hermaphroditum]